MLARTAPALAILASACARDLPPRLLVIDERLELCATAPYDATLDHVRATQWKLGLDAGEYALPDAQTLPDDWPPFAADSCPLALSLDVRDVDGARKVEAASEVAVIQNTGVSWPPDETRELMYASSIGAPPSPDDRPIHLWLAIETEPGADFSLDDPRDVGLACLNGRHGSTCPSRHFELCDPGGPTVRTRVTLDRGELVLDVRHIERDPTNGDLHRVVFVAGEIRIDGVEIHEDEFFRLLHSADFPTIGDGAYAILAPDLEAAGIACGLAITGIGTDAPRAFTVDCDLHEIEPLAIADITREALP